MSRVAVIVDGFNLYHSLQDAISDGAPASIKWLDLWALSRNFLPAFGKEAEIVSLFYCSSIQSSRGDAGPSRHKAYIRALQAKGTTITYGSFKNKPVQCRAVCKRDYKVEVEKRTDVVVATTMLELLFTKACDAVVVISGDTDLVPAYEVAKRLFPDNHVAIAFPYLRKNHEFMTVAKPRFELTIEQYKASRLPDVVNHPDGKAVFIPPTWKD